MRDLDPAALDCLAALADDGSFERAAQRLSITQSAVSQRLRALEAQVGQLLVVRARPLRLTEPGKVLLRFARQLQAMRADVARELGETVLTQTRLPIAVNADSLATWVLPALDALVQQGRGDGFGLELIVDDQDFTHEWLRQGQVLGCVSTVPTALRGCRITPLGVMRYAAVASPGFVEAAMGGDAEAGLHRGNFTQLPFLVFNRKDDMQAQWVTQAFGVREPRLVERFVPSSEAYARAAALGWGIGVLPELQVREAIGRGELIVLHPQVAIEVALYWHQWKLGDEFTAGAPRAARLDEVGAALVAGAAAALDQRPAAGPAQRRTTVRAAGSQRAARPGSAAA
ncbi:LysR family transcriptional regulator ArgP [Rivibacter subsaxonicus]|uniref:LysR family transcriptional regulator (Chromosome initiation inhibitor) n=1 Tax=Rivibacter subsaxonicus TaxID=457575 RepID=A0A4Q7VVP6_9BURK|nr:LysR family transcriptional regulator ArgP [Rivibacter subsaxonicus]RZU00747.1 LysR family transcriptional regulator (chromosome initiation inhibitor) [Rivibacter subsaxonicus]